MYSYDLIVKKKYFLSMNPRYALKTKTAMT